MRSRTRRGLAPLAAAALALGSGAQFAAGATDSAADPAYAAEAGGAWKGQYNDTPDPNQNPPGTDNGGTGFGIWNFSGGYHFDGQSPYGTTNHFIDGVDYAASVYNDLGGPAFGLANYDGPYGTTVATRPFAAPMSVGDIFSVNFDTPATYNTDNSAYFPFAIISFNDITGRKTFDIEAGKNRFYGDFPWQYDHAGGTDLSTGINPDATSDGSALSFQLTSATTGILTFDLGGPDQQAIPISLLNGQPASISFTMYENRSSGVTGEFEFFFNDLSISGIAPGNQWQKATGGSNSGNWSDAAQWSGGAIPDAIDASANFLSNAGVDENPTVTVDAERDLGVINFDNNSYSYTLAGGNSITLDVSSGEAQINSTGGSHVIDVPLVLADDTTVRVTPENGTLTLGNVQTSPAKLTKTGEGTLTVAGTFEHSGGTVVDEGTLQIGNGGTGGSVAGDVEVADDGTLAFNRSDAVTFGGVISGGGSLSKLGAGTLTLTGSNTHTGGTTVSAGTLQLGDGGTTGSISSDVSVEGGATLSFNRSDDVQFDALVSGDGGLSKLGPNTLTLTADHTYTGGTTVSAGTLVVGGTGSIMGNVVNNATLAFTRATNHTFSGDISGSGSLVKNNSVSLTLTGNSTYTGGTTVNAGMLQIGEGGTTGSIVGNVSVASASTLRFNRSDNVTFGGVISGNGSLSKLGAGILTLTEVNTYNGGTTVSAGTLQLGNGGTTGWITGNVSVGSGATLSFNRSDDITFGSVVSGSGGLTKLGGNTLTLTGNNTYSGLTTIPAGTLQVGNGGTTGSIGGNVSVGGGATLRFNRSDNLTIGGAISGGGNLVKLNPNTLVLTGNSTYTGGTTVSAGTLDIGNGGTTGSIAGNVSVASASALRFNRSNAVAFGGMVSGDGSLSKLGAGTLTLTGSNTYTGGTTVSGGTLQLGNGGATGSIAGNVTNNATLAFNRSDNIDFTDVISGSGGLTKLGGNTLTLTGNNTYGGGTTISSGTLQIGNGGTTGWITGNVTDNGTLTFNRSDDITFGSVVSGSGGLTKLGGNTLTLTGNNSYSGVTTIPAGTLQVGNGGTTGSIGGNVSVGGGATLRFNRSDNLTIGGAISGGGSLVKLNPNTLVLTGNSTYTGGTTVSAGTLDIGNGGTTGSIAGNVSVASASALRFNRSNAVAFGGVVSGDGSLSKLGAGTLTLTGSNTYTGGTTVSGGTLQLGDGATTGSISGDVIVGGGATLSFNRSDDIAFGGVVSGSGGLTKLAGNTLTVTGNNTYTGGNVVNAGTLTFSGAATPGSTTGKLTVNSVDVNGSSGQVATVNLPVSGPTTVGSLSGAATAGNSSVINAGANPLTVNQTTVGAYDGNIAGTGGFRLGPLSTNTLTLTGNPTYTGGTTVDAGRLRLTHLNQTNAVTINGGTLEVVESSPGLSSGHPSGNNASVSRPSSLTISPGATLDLTNNDLILDYTGASPVATYEALVASAFNVGVGDWSGTGITSSTAALDGNFVVAIADNAALAAPFGIANGGPLFAGVDVDIDTILIKFTHRADVDLDGVITPNDAAIFGGNYSENDPAVWSTGDMDYDGIYSPNDAAIFGGYYDESLVSLPEPATVGVLALCALAFPRRPRRRF